MSSNYYNNNSYYDTPKMDLDKHKVDLSKYVPEFLYNEKTLHKIYKSQEEQLALVSWQSNDLLNQGFIDTATWSLELWEEQYGIETNLNLSYEERREIVRAKMRGQGLCTKEMLKNVCKSFNGGTVDIIENTTPYTFTIRFIDTKGIPKNIEKLKEVINEIKPAHLLVNYQFKYNTVGYINDFTVGEISKYTVGEVMNEDLGHGSAAIKTYIMDENGDYIVDENGDYITE